MPNPLVISAVGGLLVSAISLGLAVRIGGDDIFHDARALDQLKPLIDVASHKAWRWNGGDTLALDAPINIRYEPKGLPGVSVTGPTELLAHVQVSDGRIATDTSVTRSSGRRVQAVVSGIPIRKFIVNGGENLDLGDIDQPGLDLHLNGSGTVSGRGKVDRLKLTIAGPGKANLGGLAVMDDANISILGSGDASLSPHGKVKLFIAGSGNLQLLTKPSELRQTIVGSGEISQLAGEAAQEALKAQEIARTATEAAREAVNQAQIGERVQRQVERQVERHMERHLGPPMPPFPPGPPEVLEKNGKVVVPDYMDVDLGHIERESLSVTIASSGSLTAEGKVDRLTVNVMGSGHANLAKLAARSAKVMVMGSGSVTVAPSEELKANIMGSGDVHLVTRPANIQRSIMGSGRVVEEH
jgi:hypothetical protein